MLALRAALALPPAAPLEARAAFFYTGRVLKETCAKEDDLSLGLCVGYIDSALDGLLFKDTYAAPHRICLSEQVTNAALRKAVLATLAGDADGLRLPAFTYVEKAVAAQSSCPAPKRAAASTPGPASAP